MSHEELLLNLVRALDQARRCAPELNSYVRLCSSLIVQAARFYTLRMPVEEGLRLLAVTRRREPDFGTPEHTAHAKAFDDLLKALCEFRPLAPDFHEFTIACAMMVAGVDKMVNDGFTTEEIVEHLKKSCAAAKVPGSKPATSGKDVEFTPRPWF